MNGPFTQKFILEKDVFFKKKKQFVISKQVILLFFTIFVTDFVSKEWAENVLVKQEEHAKNGEIGVVQFFKPEEQYFFVKTVDLIDPYLSIVYVRNFNIGFSILRFVERALDEKTFFYVVFFIQLSALFTLTSFTVFYFPFLILPATVVLSGGFSNVFDRYYRGYVVDFLKFRLPDSNIELLNPWPIFNFADVFITVGGILFVVRYVQLVRKNVSYYT